MNLWKALFGGSEDTPNEDSPSAADKQFDLMKFDGIKAMKMGQWDYALRCFEEALKVREDLEVHEQMANTLIRLDRLDEALEQLQRLADAEPQNTAVLTTMAHVAYMKEDYVRMAEICQLAVGIAPSSAMAHYQWAQSALGQGDFVNGIARLTKAIALDDTFADARLLRAKTLLQMGDATGAQQDSEWLNEHIEEQEDVLLLAARVACAKGQIIDAISLYDKVIEQNPFALEAYQERGKLHYDQGHTKEAEADMKKVLELNPQQLADVSGDYSAEGVEQQTKRAYSVMNPFGI